MPSVAKTRASFAEVLSNIDLTTADVVVNLLKELETSVDAPVRFRHHSPKKTSKQDAYLTSHQHFASQIFLRSTSL